MAGETYAQKRHHVRHSALGTTGADFTDAPDASRITTITYLVALLIIAGISLTSHILTGRIVERQQSTALVVNTAGRQRMLSQRIARFADEVSNGSRDAATGRSEILALAAQMEAAQRLLVDGDAKLGVHPVTSPDLRALYFDGPVHLQLQVNQFLEHTRALANSGAKNPGDPDLMAIRQAANVPLLKALDAAVSQYQADSEHEVRHLRHVMSTLTGIMMMVLILEALLIYRPLFNRLSNAILLLTKASTTDFLTGVMNRRAFIIEAEREVARAERQGQPLCMLIADLDHFKRINDTYGHGAGDVVLRHFTAVAAANLRVPDSLGRLGGEEFAILMPGATLQGAAMAADRIRERFASTTAAVTPNAERILATVSFGVVWSQGGSVSELLAEADRLLYRAKHSGRNRVESGVLNPPEEAPPRTAALGSRG